MLGLTFDSRVRDLRHLAVCIESPICQRGSIVEGQSRAFDKNISKKFSRFLRLTSDDPEPH